MKYSSIVIVSVLFCPLLVAQNTPAPEVRTERGPYARIATLRPFDGDTIDFEAGYIRHLDWHRQAGDRWIWYGWTIWAGAHQRWFVYATFGHSAADLSNPISPAEDERDNIANVTPHAQFVANGLYEYMAAFSRGTGEPQPAAKLELMTVDVVPAVLKDFEAALRDGRSSLEGETLWYRMVAGGPTPRYVRLRPRSDLTAILETSEREVPDKVRSLTTTMTVEILNFRPGLSLGVVQPRR